MVLILRRVLLLNNKMCSVAFFFFDWPLPFKECPLYILLLQVWTVQGILFIILVVLKISGCCLLAQVFIFYNMTVLHDYLPFVRHSQSILLSLPATNKKKILRHIKYIVNVFFNTHRKCMLFLFWFWLKGVLGVFLRS